MPSFGALIFPSDYSIQPVELAQAVEDRGLYSLFFTEHTHIPISRKTPLPGGGELPKEYSHTHDQFVALTAAAVATKQIKLGTGICLVIERDPIILAKEVASLDMISNGRVILGVGGGWNVEEMETMAQTSNADGKYFVNEIERELLPLAHEENLAVIAFNPLADGLLTGKYKL